MATGSQKSGFTLVELVIVLSVLVLLSATAIPSIDGVMKERQAREPVGTLLLMAREVRNRALTEQRPYQIAFDSDGFRASRYFNPYGGREEFDKLQDLLKVQQDRLDIIAASRDRGIQMEEQTADPRIESAVAGLSFSASYEIPEGVDYRLRSWRDTDWLEMEGGAFRRWVFQPSGMCDPLKIQFQSDNAFFEVEFHPLTADIKSETSWVD
ncbi:MAG: prepilin-type N-terminal cleavage/methylation domain-containing protein [Verrucomicrobiales bacterium]|nr:prepilin-type N-terminal cleavage/methylation domain-containing protein [Verrucomicrobiales bacterium]